MKFYKADALALRAKAFQEIQFNKVLWKLWNDAIEAEDRELMMAWVINEQATDEAFDRGWDQGREGIVECTCDYSDQG